MSAESMIQKDRERAVYGLKEKNLARTYIKLIPLGMRDPDAIRLLHWKKPVDKPTDGDKPVGTPQTIIFSGFYLTFRRSSLDLSVLGRFSRCPLRRGQKTDVCDRRISYH